MLEWGVRPEQTEGRFTSALLSAIQWSGRISQSAQAEFRALSKKQEDVAKLEHGRAQELAKATKATLEQARSALINLEIERENLTTRMLQETLPLFADKMQKVLTVRVKDETDVLRFRRVLLAGAATLAVFLCGFGLHAWEDSAKIAAMDTCLARLLPGQGANQGHTYCDVSSLYDAAR